MFPFISSLHFHVTPTVITREWHLQACSVGLWRWTCDGLHDPATQFRCRLGVGRAEESEYRLGGGAGAIGWGEKSKLQPFIYFPHQHSTLNPSEAPRGEITHAAPSLMGQSAGLTNACWVRSFVNVLVFSETQQWRHSFTKRFIQQSGFSCVSCSFKSLHRFITIDGESCNVWLWLSSLAYPHILLWCELWAQLSRSVHSLLQVVEGTCMLLSLAVLGREAGRDRTKTPGDKSLQFEINTVYVYKFPSKAL